MRKFPVLFKKACLSVRPCCSQCKKKTAKDNHDIAAIMGGAMKLINKRGDTEMAEGCVGFLDIHWHGNVCAMLPIVEDSPNGQFDLYFCSTACLRGFFNACVDELERKVQKETI